MLMSISEFGTKLVAGLSGLIFAIIILVCVVVAKSKKNEHQYPDTKIGKTDDKAPDKKDKKDKKNKKGKKNSTAEAEDTQQAPTPDDGAENVEDKKDEEAE